ncbi:MAG: DEAD/DEAH box helicase [Candidatus Aenigmatarchaeota archaeon]
MEFVIHPWINQNAIEKRDYQDNIVKVAVTGNTLCVLPTGLGKTNIAALVAADRLMKFPDNKILFMAPTKPLVEQHKKTFEKFLKLGLELRIATGKDNPEERAKLYKDGNIIFATPQTIRNDIKRGIIDLKSFSLLIVDECHRAIGNYAYPAVAKSFIYNSKSPLILGLTASPGSFRQKIDEVKKRLFIEHVEIRMRDDEDVRPFVQELEQEWVEVKLSEKMGEMKKILENLKNERIKKLMNWKILFAPIATKSRLIELQQSLARKKTGMSWAAMSVIAEIMKIDHALILIETQSLYSLKNYLENLREQKTKAVARLFNNEDFNKVISIADELISNGDEHPKLQKLREIIEESLEDNKYASIIVFVQYRDTITKILEILKGIKFASPIEFIGQTKKAGKGLSQKEQVQILNEFRMGFYNILIASQIGEEGLDIEETDTVVFYEPIPSAIRKIQRTGRTARTKPGKVITLITKGTRDEAYHWSGYQKEKKMKKILYGMKNENEQKDLTSF